MMTQNTTSLREMMVDTQIRPSDVTKFPIIDAFLTIEREAFIPEEAASIAYADAAITVAPGRETLEARTLAKMLDALNLSRSDLTLVVGCGLGYSAAIVAHMVDAVVAVETDDLAGAAETALNAQGIHNVAVFAGQLVDGHKASGPYEAILIEGGVDTVSAEILSQLADGGRIIAIFHDGTVGEARLGIKSNERVSWRPVFNASASILPGMSKEQDFKL